ncbi:uncharacterized protein [Amphiura filiformis]|uniref:uncharacterized protein n=1 Tax=Amphiura filiformis TaxID=82378 RepID=UPI003B21127A
MEEEPMEIEAGSSKMSNSSNENSCDASHSNIINDVGDGKGAKETSDNDVTSVRNKSEPATDSVSVEPTNEAVSSSENSQEKTDEMINDSSVKDQCDESTSNPKIVTVESASNMDEATKELSDKEGQSVDPGSVEQTVSGSKAASDKESVPGSTNVNEGQAEPEDASKLTDNMESLVDEPVSVNQTIAESKDKQEQSKSTTSSELSEDNQPAKHDNQEDSDQEIFESIDLDAEDEGKGHDSGGRSDDDEGVQEIHDVEPDYEEEGNTVGDLREEKVGEADHAPNKDGFLSYEAKIQDLTKKVTSLQSELEETRKKLTRAEKKLNRSRRHKESAESYNYDLRRRVKHLKKEVHRFRKAAKKTFAEVGCQTMPTESSGGALAEADHDDVIEIPSTSTGGLGIGSSRGHGGWGYGDDHHHQSLADSLKATAEAALSNSGYVLDQTSGLYYDYSTGYYYDPVNHLYYDPNTGVYYYYDQGSRTYQFHSQVTVDPTGMLPLVSDRPRRGKRKKDRRQRESTPEYNDLEAAMSNLSITSWSDLSTTSGSPSSPSQVAYQGQPTRNYQPIGMQNCNYLLLFFLLFLPKLLLHPSIHLSGFINTAQREVGEDGMECEVIEVLDDDSPENKRPKKSRRKSTKGKKAPHTTTTSEDPTNKETDDKELTSKDEQSKSKDADNSKSSSSPKEKTSQKKASKKSSKTSSSEQKDANNSENKTQEEMNEKEKTKQTNKEKTKDKESLSSAEAENETCKDPADNKQSDDDACSDSEQVKSKETEASAKEGSLQESNTEVEKQGPESEQTAQPQGDKENDEATTSVTATAASVTAAAAGASGDKTTPPVSEKATEGSPDEESRIVGDDEIMEVESKRKEDIEEITILDSEDDDSEMEEGELSDSSADFSSSEESSECESDVIAEVVAVRQEFPPCIRMIVTRSDKIQLGSLFVVTCTGGTIGREGSNHVVTIPELGVSKQHAQIKYNDVLKQYSITDLGSQNGTLINGKMLSKARSVSEPHPVSHKDYLTVGSTTLRVHIHPGTDTCDECEPGQVQALIAQLNPENNQVTYTVVSAADKEQMRRKELRKLKKKYNLARDNYVQQQDPSSSNSSYVDRAGARRKTVGSDNPYQPDDAPASVDRAISDTNVGRKMLEKMGWKEGKGLGKGDSGIKEPIQVLVHNKNAGLGAGVGVSMDQAQYMTQGRKNQRWQRAKARFDKVQQQESGGASSSNSNMPTQWVSGGTEALDDVMSKPADGDNEADAQEDCIEILSPGSEDNPLSPVEVQFPSSSPSSSTIQTDTVSISSTSTTSTVTAATLIATAAPNPATETRPKIQMKLQPKKVKEQLPTSSVVLDDGDDDDDVEEAMEVSASGDQSRDTRTSARKGTRWETGGKDENNKESENNGDDTPAENSTGPESVIVPEPVDSGLENNVASSKGGTELDSNVAASKGDAGLENNAASTKGGKETTKSSKGKSGKSPKSKWVNIGVGGNQNKTDKGEEENNDSQQKEKGAVLEEGASSTSAITDTHNDSQTDSTRGRKRRTRRNAKKNEDMFADL